MPAKYGSPLKRTRLCRKHAGLSWLLAAGLYDRQGTQPRRRERRRSRRWSPPALLVAATIAARGRARSMGRSLAAAGTAGFKAPKFEAEQRLWMSARMEEKCKNEASSSCGGHPCCACCVRCGAVPNSY